MKFLRINRLLFMATFLQRVERDIDERKTALFEIERVLFTKRYNLSKTHLEIFTVQSITMMYSIWEGYIQKAFGRYIDELNEKSLDCHLIQDSLLIHYMEDKFKQFNEYPNKPNKKIDFYNSLKVFFESNKIELKSVVNTQSNVSFEVLNGILKSFCLEPFPDNWKHYKHPHPSLKESLKTFLRYRNSVAHGGDISSEEKVSQQVFGKYKNLVIDLMYEIMFKMELGLNNRTYLK